jgi:4-hydroxy-tetrahydrodipicolinate synthase
VTTFTFDFAHAPVTPFAAGQIDHARYRRVLDFHIANGAERLALPMHAGESVSLTLEERKALLAFAVDHVKGRVPIIANVSEAGTAMAASLAADAKKAGAAAIVASVPYYWTPPQSMLVEHFAAIAEAGQLPLFVFNAPAEMNEMEVASESVVDLLHRSPFFAGLIDASLDWQYMIEIVTVARAVRPDFQFVSGTEYMISAAAVGATGLVSPLAGVAPQMLRSLYDLCRAEKFKEARPVQEQVAILYRAIAAGGEGALKAAIRNMGRDCGPPRPPLAEPDRAATDTMMAALAAAKVTASEPRDWARGS